MNFATCIPAIIAGLIATPTPQGITIALDAPTPYHAPRKPWKSKAPVYKWNVAPLSRDQWIIAASAWGECRSHGKDCMQATINVMHNRAVRFGTSTAIEAMRHAQLTCWMPDDPNRRAMYAIGRWMNPKSPDGIAWTIARGLAIRETAHDLPDLTHKAQFYHTRDVHPKWDKDMRQVAAIGAHIYFVRKDARA